MTEDGPKAVPFRGLVKLLRCLVGRTVDVEVLPVSDGTAEAFRVENVVLQDVADIPASDRLHDCDAVSLELFTREGTRLANFVLYEDVAKAGRADFSYQTVELRQTILTIWDRDTVEFVRTGGVLPS